MDEGERSGVSMISFMLKDLFLNLATYPELWSEALVKFLNKENPWDEAESKLLRLLKETGWSERDIDLLQSEPAALQDLHTRMFPTPVLDQLVVEVFTEAALEEIEQGLGLIRGRLVSRLKKGNVIYVRDLAKKTEQQVDRFAGRRSSKTFKAIKMLLAKHGLHLGMKLS